MNDKAGMGGLPSAVAKTCPTCKGRGYWQSRRGGEKWDCISCQVPTDAIIEYVAEHLTEEQREMLLFGATTMAPQIVTPEDWDGRLLCGFYVVGDDEIDLGDGIFWPATRHWFASSEAHYKGDGGPWHLSFRYNALGIVLRDRLRPATAREQGK